MPLDKDTATKYINFLKPLVEWQSTVDYLKEPPQGYLSEGVDLVRGLQDIESALHSGVYQNELDFLLAIRTLVVRARDAHFAADIGLLGGLFTFRRGAAFAAISKDGTAIPEIFLSGKYRPKLFAIGWHMLMCS